MKTRTATVSPSLKPYQRAMAEALAAMACEEHIIYPYQQVIRAALTMNVEASAKRWGVTGLPMHRGKDWVEEAWMTT